MTFVPRPPGICEPCWSRRADNWMTGLAFYCAHTRNFVHRLTVRAEWYVKRNVSGKEAQAMLSGATERAKAEAARRGIPWDQVEGLIQETRR